MKSPLWQGFGEDWIYYLNLFLKLAIWNSVCLGTLDCCQVLKLKETALYGHFVDHVIKTKPLPVSPWKLRSAKYDLKVLENAWKLCEVLKNMDIHDLIPLFKTGFYKTIPDVGCIGSNVTKSGTPVLRWQHYKQCTMLTFGKVFKNGSHFEFSIFAQSGKTQNCFHLLNH